tara:strand:- start:457 stop:813 length:357 start_codon:yes stop_codon:yes gene_type:complete
VLFAISNTLLDSADDIACLADADTYLALLVANDNDGPEAHLFTAFDGLGDAADLHHALLPFGIALLIAPAAATISATAAITASATTATTAFALPLPLPFSSGWNVGGAWNVLAGSLVS